MTTTTRPAPSWSAGASARWCTRCAGTGRRGHRCPVAIAAPTPSTVPATTSDG
ncbi:hypothetical protein [Streptomyces sp. PT12]|uniref:hypothetical protein n=1 Tax=Streptomyces sp. PT12 TaxID=1510197 RepID=UPI0028525064|nr:hypothetical protein [Streptomyces sp. PT12]